MSDSSKFDAGSFFLGISICFFIYTVAGDRVKDKNTLEDRVRELELSISTPTDALCELRAEEEGEYAK